MKGAMLPEINFVCFEKKEELQAGVTADSTLSLWCVYLGRKGRNSWGSS